MTPKRLPVWVNSAALSEALQRMEAGTLSPNLTRWLRCLLEMDPPTTTPDAP